MSESFLPIDKEQWLEKIKKDLKGSDPEDFHWSINERINIDPFTHSEDFEHKPMVSGKVAETNSWKSAITFPAVALQPDNKLLLEALNHGLEKPIIQIDSSERSFDWSTILKGVVPAYIDLCIDLPENSDSQSLTGLFSAISKEDHKNITLRQRRPIIENEDFNTVLLLEEDSTLDIDKAIATLVTEAFHYLNQENTRENSVVFRIQSSHSFHKEIAKIRALNIVWANVTQEISGEIQQAEIEVWINQRNYNEDPYQNLYIGSTLALAAAIGGANSIIIDRPDIHTEQKLNASNQLALNIHHLLRQESYLDRVVDPSRGSYVIEELTNKIAQSAWSLFQGSL